MTTSTPKTPIEQELMDGLTLNLNLSKELLTTLQEESVALRTMDTQGLFHLSRQKETLLAKIHFLDDSLRKSLAEQDKSSAATPERTQVLRQYREKITAMRQEIQTRNMINKRFTEDTLGYLSDAISLITRPPQSDHNYRLPGRSLPPSKTQPSYISRGV